MGTGVKVLVPEGMLDAACEQYEVQLRVVNGTQGVEKILASALRWLADNPIVPNDDNVRDVSMVVGPGTGTYDMMRGFMVGWQRRMFLAPEPEVPQELESLLFPTPSGIPVVMTPSCVTVQKEVNDRIIEAYRRGQKAGK